MDEARLRAARQAAGRPEPTTSDSGSKPPEHRPVSSRNHNHAPAKTDKKPKRLYVAIAAAAVVVVGIVGWLAWTSMATGTGIDGNKYQAVFFTNGQVYFGKLHSFNNEYMKLNDVYYLQSQATATGTDDDPKNPQASNDSNNLTLIKLGNGQIHSPEDEMIISKNQILFYENLKSDGQVAQSIEKYKSSN